MSFNAQTILENENVILYPLQAEDFEDLYAVASDPKIWEQHPNKDRWKREIFLTFFEGAIQSKGAYKIVDKHSGKTIGSTRFYDFDEKDSSVFIGYTFYAASCWGKGINPQVKKLMLDYSFRFVAKVYFSVGANNLRSQIGVSRLGAEKTGEEETTSFGEATKLSFVYTLIKQKWNEHAIHLS